ncbi:MAG TPA: transketolase C-terminal domain-containing protein [Candidatus Hydrogenedentes bacterium]|nr:transketolase C-terminal domain-containing protein [Candidatus Hydrogenedentota bacterium]
MRFPIDVSGYKPVAIDPFGGQISPAQRAQLLTNIQIVRDTIIFFTAVAGAKGLGGHTGGAYSIVPEVLIADAFMKGNKKIYPVYFDEGGHRVAIQYAMAAFNGEMPFEKLLLYRAANEGLYGHPELEPELGIKFASGRLGHLWPFVNGVAKAHPDKVVFLFGSDGSQQEGDDAEAARLAVAQQLNIKICIDDNDVTISGHPSRYLPGFDLARTLKGHGLTVDVGEGEDVDALFARMLMAVRTEGPVALINKRVMAPGVPGIEASHAGHDVIGKDNAVAYLTQRGLNDAVAFLNGVEKVGGGGQLKGSSADSASNRSEFGKIVNEILDGMPEAERVANVLVIDSDLEGSTGLKTIREKHTEVFINGGVQERGNFSAAAGFGFEQGRQGIFSTFSAFLEMVVSELTMARLNRANMICHFSHAGIDDMADNTCHYGVNIFYADNGLPEGDTTRLYFAADALQLKSLVHAVWNDGGIRFIFSTRSKVPFILKEDGSKYFDGDYRFTPGKDEFIRRGSAGYVVSYGDLLYRALDAVERARDAGIDVGLVNKPTLNAVDEDAIKTLGAAPFVIVAETQNVKTGLGSRFGTWFLERGYAPRFAAMGVSKIGRGGLSEHIPHQGLDPDSILAKITQLAG